MPKKKHRTFLVVEDNHPSQQYLRILLNKLDRDVITAGSGEEALHLIEDQIVDGLLLDISLGSGMTGMELMETLRLQEKYRNVPMVAVTAYSELQTEILTRGFNDYLAKPYTFDDLKAILEKYDPTLN